MIKANNVADLLYSLGWRAHMDAQHDHITRVVVGNELLDAIFEDRKEIEIFDREEGLK